MAESSAQDRSRQGDMYRTSGNFTTLSPLNTSASKQMYTFSKAQRFNPKMNETVANDFRSTFNLSKASQSSNMGFGSQTRFAYYPTPDKHGKMPSPVFQEKRTHFSPNQTQNSYSFGVSRDSMKKLYIQEIERQAELEKLPGPDRYQIPNTFGRTGIHFSMRPDLPRQQMDLLGKKKGMLPGPSSYKQIDMVGNTNSNKLTSINKTPIANTQQSVPGTQQVITHENHSLSTLKEHAPGSHTPRHNFTEYNGSSRHRFVGRTAFGKDERKALEQLHKVHIENQGKYNRLCEFGKYIIMPQQ